MVAPCSDSSNRAIRTCTRLEQMERLNGPSGLPFGCCREVQEEVLGRARREMAQSVGGTPSSGPVTLPAAAGSDAVSSAPAPDIAELVDDLRAEVASTRAVLAVMKQNKSASGSA